MVTLPFPTEWKQLMLTSNSARTRSFPKQAQQDSAGHHQTKISSE